MNSTIMTAYAVAQEAPTEENKTELAELFIPKYRKIHKFVQDAVRAINRHVAPGKGYPNRNRVAQAVGLAFDLNQAFEIASFLEDATTVKFVEAAKDAVINITKMNATGLFNHIEFLPDFKTEDEIKADNEAYVISSIEKAAVAVNAALASIAKANQIGNGGPNTFKVAKAVGFKNLCNLLDNNILAEDGHAEDLDIAKKLVQRIDAIANARETNGYGNVDTTPFDYPKFVPFEDSDEGEEEGEDY